MHATTEAEELRVGGGFNWSPQRKATILFQSHLALRGKFQKLAACCSLPVGAEETFPKN
jgi:hypothetical protein